MPKLTQVNVRSLQCPPGKKLVYLWDSAAPGLGVRASSGGVQAFVFRSRDSAKKQHIETLGRVAGMTLDQARTAANLKRAHVPDVTSTQEITVAFPTLHEAFETYVSTKAHCLKPGTITDYRKNFLCYLGKWQDRPMNSITSAEVIKFYQELLQRSKAKAAYAMRILSFIYNLQIDVYGYPHKNPVVALKAQRLVEPVAPRERRIPAGDLPVWWSALETLDADPKDYLKIGLLLGFRRKTLLTLRWDLLDLERRQYRLLAETEGNKARETLDYPIGPYTAEILKKRKASASPGNEWIFPGGFGRKDSHAQGFEKSFIGLRKRTGVRVSPHDLRRTRATVAYNMGLNTITLKRLLTHRLDHAPAGEEVTGGYSISDTESLRPHVETVERMILQLAGATLPEYRLKMIMGAEPGEEPLDEIWVDLNQLLTPPNGTSQN
jgi:integrase